MHFLTIPGLQTPATHQAWAALDEDELAQVGEVYKEQVYIDAHDSPMVTAVKSAFSIKDINGRRCVPVHELEYVLARFGIAVGDAFDLQFMATAITPSALTRIEAHITSMASWPGLPATDDKHELARRLAKLASGMTAADLVQLHIDDFFTLEELADTQTQAIQWTHSIELQTLMDSGYNGSLAVYGVLAGLLGMRSRDDTRIAPMGRIRTVMERARSASQENREYDVAPEELSFFIGRTDWPPQLALHIASKLDAFHDIQGRKSFFKGDAASIATAVTNRLCDAIGAWPTLCAIVVPDPPPVMMANIRQMLASLDDLSTYRGVISLESIDALDALLLRLGHSVADGATATDRVEAVTSRHRARAHRADAAASAGSNAVGHSTSSSSSAVSSVPSCFQRQNTDWLDHQLTTRDVYCKPLVFRTGPDTGLDEKASGLVKLVEHYKEQPVQVCRVVANSRSQFCLQFMLSNVPPPPDSAFFATLAIARPAFGAHVSNVVVTPDSGIVPPGGFGWRAGCFKGETIELQQQIPKDFLKKLINGEWDSVDFYNTLFASSQQFQCGVRDAQPRVKLGAHVASQWTRDFANEVIQLTEHLFSAFGYVRNRKSGFKAIADDALAFHRCAPASLPQSHAETAQTVCSYALADAGAQWSAWFKGPPSESFPEFVASDASSRARTLLNDKQEGYRNYLQWSKQYAYDAPAPPPPPPPPAIGDGAGPPSKKQKRALAKAARATLAAAAGAQGGAPKPGPKTPTVRPPGTMKDMVDETPTHIIYNWAASGSSAARVEKFDKQQIMNVCGSSCCFSFQIMNALQTRIQDPEERRLNALAWCNHWGDANHESKDSPLHQTCPALTRALVTSPSFMQKS